jgi:hypothetical protein
MQIPGVDRVIAASLIAEIGIDMSVFLSVHHLAAWAGVCPRWSRKCGKAAGAICHPVSFAREAGALRGGREANVWF